MVINYIDLMNSGGVLGSLGCEIVVGCGLQDLRNSGCMGEERSQKVCWLRMNGKGFSVLH